MWIKNQNNNKYVGQAKYYIMNNKFVLNYNKEINPHHMSRCLVSGERVHKYNTVSGQGPTAITDGSETATLVLILF